MKWGGGGVRIIQYGVLGRNETSRATANDWLFFFVGFLGGGGGGKSIRPNSLLGGMN